jgi:hypothetical protein
MKMILTYMRTMLKWWELSPTLKLRMVRLSARVADQNKSSGNSTLKKLTFRTVAFKMDALMTLTVRNTKKKMTMMMKLILMKKFMTMDLNLASKGSHIDIKVIHKNQHLTLKVNLHKTDNLNSINNNSIKNMEIKCQPLISKHMPVKC